MVREARRAQGLATKDAKLELLRRVPLFAGCERPYLHLIEQLADEVDVADGYHLMREGAFAQEFFVIVEGRVRIERGDKVINTLGPGDFLGEIAMIDHGRRTATAVTDGPAKLLVINRQGFNSLLAASPQISLDVMKALATRVRNLEPETPH
jgi:CRP/FNR family transcriptional regulator, cyclic AMP receptor protein